MSQPQHAERQNLILASLTKANYAALKSNVETVEAPQRTVLYEAGTTIRHVYFPRTALISLVGFTAEGQGTEVGMIGGEGFCGIPVMFGGTSQQYDATVQMTGIVDKMPVHLLNEQNGKTPLSDMLRRYALIQLNQITQSAICNRFHTLTQRLCRWLLTAADRTDTNALELTQEYLSQMIGARRPALAHVVGRLQRKGLIRGQRNCIRLVHRQGLEALSCECYGVVRHDIEAFVEGLALPRRAKSW